MERTYGDFACDASQISKIFNPNPNSGEQLPFPACSQQFPFQMAIQQGVANFATSSTAGLILILPRYAEKIMGWHYPQYPSTQTMGNAEPLWFTLDMDSYHQMARELARSFTVVANTVSSTSFAVGGIFNVVKAYNSLAYLKGNDTSVYQVYSYSNLPGLTPDPACKVTGVPAWKGVGGFFVGEVREGFSRLEDSATYAPSSDVNPTASYAKFVNQKDAYTLNTVMQLTDAAGEGFSCKPGEHKDFDLGTILKDGLRASSINWSLAMRLNVESPSIPIAQRACSVAVKYSAYDIAGNVVNGGILLDEAIRLFGASGDLSVSFNINRSGSFPDNLNVDETQLVPPVRSLKFTLVVGCPEQLSVTEPLELSITPAARFIINYSVPNGLTDGMSNNPILIAYDGVTEGQQINVTSSVLYEAIPDSTTAKFTTPRYRKSKSKQEEAIMKIAANPLKYGIRWVCEANQLEAMTQAFRQAVAFETCKDEEKFVEGLKLIKLLQEKKPIEGDKNPATIHEASMRSIWKKIEKGLKGAGKATWNEVIKPVAKEEFQRLKTLPKDAANAFLTNALTAVAATNEYQPPRAYYPTTQTSFVGPSAATGYIPRAEVRKRYVACMDSRELGADSDSISETGKPIVDEVKPAEVVPSQVKLIVQPRVGYLAATKNPKMSLANTPVKKEKPSPVEIFDIPMENVTLFPTVNLTRTGDLQDDELCSAVEIFAVVPLRLCPNLPMLPYIYVGGKKIVNYAFYDSKNPIEKVNITPKEDVVLLRVDKVKRNSLQLHTTNMPVGGRSLELALYAFNNNFTGYYVYTGSIESGNVGKIADDMMLLKIKYIHDNHFVSVGNGSQFVIDVPTTLKLCDTFRRTIRSAKSMTRYNASSDLFEISPTDLKVACKDLHWINHGSSIYFMGPGISAFTENPAFLSLIRKDEDWERLFIVGRFPEGDIFPLGVCRKMISAVHRVTDLDQENTAVFQMVVQLNQKQSHELSKFLISTHFHLFPVNLTNLNYQSNFNNFNNNLISIPIAMMRSSRPRQNRGPTRKTPVLAKSATTSPFSNFFVILERVSDPNFLKAKDLYMAKLGGQALTPKQEKEFRKSVELLNESVNEAPLLSDSPFPKVKQIETELMTKNSKKALAYNTALSVSKANKILTRWSKDEGGLKALSQLFDIYAPAEQEGVTYNNEVQAVLYGKQAALKTSLEDVNAYFTGKKTIPFDPFYAIGFFHYLLVRAINTGSIQPDYIEDISLGFTNVAPLDATAFKNNFINVEKPIQTTVQQRVIKSREARSRRIQEGKARKQQNRNRGMSPLTPLTPSPYTPQQYQQIQEQDNQDEDLKNGGQ